jgi:hypothetical protein
MVLANDISARKNSRREVGGPAQRLQAAVEQLTGEHSTPTLDFISSDFSRRVPSSKHCDPVWRQAQLTDAIGLSGAAVVGNYYVAHLACCLVYIYIYAMELCAPQAPVRLARD